MNSTTSPARRGLSARRVALLATTIAGFGAAAFFAPQAPNAVCSWLRRMPKI